MPASIFEMPLEVLQKHVAKFEALAAEMAELLPGAANLTEQERRETDGKFRSGEAAALGSVLDAADARAELFSSLADKDGGHDPSSFETDFLREELARIELLGRAQTALETLNVSDSILRMGEQVKPVLLAAYHLGKLNAQHDAAVRSRMAAALDYYSRIARKSAATKKERTAG
jgi:hypothetical protein